MTLISQALDRVERSADSQPHHRRARWARFHVMLVAPIGIVCLLSGIVLLVIEGEVWAPPLIFVVVGVWSLTGAIALIRRGEFRMVLSVFLMVGVVANYAAMAINHDGATALGGLMVILIVATWTQTWPLVLLTGFLCTLSVLGWPMIQGLPPETITPNAIAGRTVLLVLATLASTIGTYAFHRVLGQLEDNLDRNQSLADELSRANVDLERRVADRTKELQDVLHRQRKLAAELDELAQRDELTGLYNRRRLMNTLTSPIVADQPHSLVMVDIDRFKEINDTFGHVAGDDVLRRIGSTLSNLVREGDVLARIGGEEFALLLPGTGQDAAMRLGERLRDAVASLSWEAELEPNHRVTISVGVASTDQDHQSTGEGAYWEQLLLHADQAMYVAKASGRNRTVAATGAATRRYDIRAQRRPIG